MWTPEEMSRDKTGIGPSTGKFGCRRKGKRAGGRMAVRPSFHNYGRNRKWVRERTNESEWKGIERDSAELLPPPFVRSFIHSFIHSRIDFAVGHQRVGTGTSGSPLERDGRERGGEDFSFSESKGNTFGTTAGGGTGRPRLGKSGTATSSSGVVGGVGGGRGRGRGRQTGGGSRAFSGDVGDVSASSSSFHMQQQRRERERETRGSVGTEGSVNPDERAAVASGIPNAPLLDDVDEGDLGPKQECPDCGRLFNSSAFAKHRNVCKKVFVQKRRRFDSMKRRIADIDGAQDMMRRKEVEERAERRGGARGAAAALHRSSENTAVGGKQNNNKGNAWRLKSQAFRAAIAAARGDSSPAAAEQAAQAQAQLEALGPDPNTSACPHCGRRMNDTAAAKHVPICQKVFGNKGGRLAKGTGQGLGVAARGAGRTSEGRGSNGAARVKRRS
uniref:C2HC/C3H-type domain-containing protein n=1 Tax=Chromera velia CCMP2878 TaxID=1169474 RepID=A0A0G4HUN2_9ALVE|eukprot:Cvel_31919.t1-p1 / transcript=Cvel_31919.t1 / gene=Cvel_31919 / organism=Chromera_velia_CCMP2878 / gene_product=hypothetical protein / transcript_product=hypothetical protein / location=Cvel_scaffold4849:488-6177(+) / protein_length=443 / sequence_SO=supercontig / SO=protein_coding / is_pseudo=false